MYIYIYSIYSLEHSATIIDNILTNKIFRSDSKYLFGIILEDISDHLPIFYICSHIPSTLVPNFINTRNFKQLSLLEA